MAPSIHILNPEDPYGPMAPVALAIALWGLILMYKDCRDLILLPLICTSLILVAITVEPLANGTQGEQSTKHGSNTKVEQQNSAKH